MSGGGDKQLQKQLVKAASFSIPKLFAKFRSLGNSGVINVTVDAFYTLSAVQGIFLFINIIQEVV